MTGGLVTAVVAHGTGSRPDFVRACLQRPLAEVGVRLVPVPLRGHGGDERVDGLGIDQHAADLAAAARAEGATVVGGISLGAHAAARLAVDRLLPGLTGLLLTWPAWTGPPDLVAAANADQAEQLDREGLAAVLARVRAGAPAWVADEVASSWSSHHLPSFIAALRAVAVSPAPTLVELAAIPVRAAVAVMDDDPLHPARVGRAWAAALPRGALRATTLAAVTADREALGRALADAWRSTG